MEFLIQPKVNPVSEDLDLSSKTALITGGTSGIGFQAAKLYLYYGARVILACRNLQKGEKARNNLISEPSLQKRNLQKEDIQLYHLDMQSLESVERFCQEIQKDYPNQLNIVLLGAGIVLTDDADRKTEDGHNDAVQTNFISNAIISLKLLPVLEKAPNQSRLTWITSRHHPKHTIDPADNESVIQHAETKHNPPYSRYVDSRMLSILYLRRLASSVLPSQVIINSFCPGMVDTEGLSGLEMPFYIKWVVNLIRTTSARPPEEGGWIAVRVSNVIGEESHGRFLEDDRIKSTSFVETQRGEQLAERVYNEILNISESIEN